MGHLLDTHALIWYFEDSSDMPEKIFSIIENPMHHKFISSASLWEIAIKISIGKLEMKLSFDDLLDAVLCSELTVLQLDDEYLKEITNLPFIHKDPFDRLIISTALIENLTIITIDENIQKYKISWIW
ncbi:MAG: type II toxin-antitoxin system VapC family toxin [Defluviitaleaceae bacterium]|nr:type II toxin-antitoxin system VapC family toxin [Defluviitaleaceae bacterium]